MQPKQFQSWFKTYNSVYVKKTKSCLTGTVVPHVSSVALTSAPIALIVKLLHFVTYEARETSSAGVLSDAAGSPHQIGELPRERQRRKNSKK